MQCRATLFPHIKAFSYSDTASGTQDIGTPSLCRPFRLIGFANRPGARFAQPRLYLFGPSGAWHSWMTCLGWCPRPTGWLPALLES